jgi:quercetin dioxygenase-like cupin family protein
MPNVVLRSEESDGVVSVIELSSPPGFKGPPLHHHAFDEAFYVLEGELTFQLRDEVFTRRAGELAFAPRHDPPEWARQNYPQATVVGPQIGM